MRKATGRVLALMLTFVQLWVYGMPATVFAAGAGDPEATGSEITTIVAPEQIIMPVGTAQADLGLPDVLEATVTVESGSGTEEQAVSLPVAGWACEDYDPDVAGSYTFAPMLGELPYPLAEGLQSPGLTVTLEAPAGDALDMPPGEERAIVIAAFSPLANKVAQQEYTAGHVPQEGPVLPQSLEATDSDGQPLSVQGVTWDCPDYDAAAAGTYTFTTVLTEDYETADSVSAPVITVTLLDELPAALAADEASAGTGSAGNPIVIRTASEWYGYVAAYNDGSLFATLSLPDDSYLYFRLTADIDLSAFQWIPMGNSTRPFYGHFDGGGHSVSKLTISALSSTEQGLFGVVGYGAVVENLALENCDVTAGNDSGALAGLNYGAVQNCSVSGVVQGGGAGNIGGIVGRIGEQNGQGGKVLSCLVTANVTGGNQSGGIAGATADTGSIKNSVVLCQDISATVTADRLVPADTVNASGNLGWDGVLGTNLGNLHGDGMLLQSRAAFLQPDGWPSTLKTAPWSYSAGMMPALNGQSTELPSYMGESFPGSGTEADPYLIRNEEDLRTFADNASKRNYYAGQYVRLENNITLDGSSDNNWTPMRFSGTFLGNKKTIANLRINLPEQKNVGFFAATWSGASVQDLYLVNAQVTGGDLTGALVGYATDTRIEGCAAVDGSVTGINEVGGLVGGQFGYGENYIKECMTSNHTTGTSSVGGLVGKIGAVGDAVVDCYTTGKVTGRQANAIGGVVGHVHYPAAVVRRCYSTAVIEVQSKAQSGNYLGVGGVLGNTAGSSYALVAVNQSIAVLINDFAVKNNVGYNYYEGHHLLYSWVMLPINGTPKTDPNKTYTADMLANSDEPWRHLLDGGGWSRDASGLPTLDRIDAAIQDGSVPGWLMDNYEELYGDTNKPETQDGGNTYIIRTAGNLGWLSAQPVDALHNKKITFAADISLEDYSAGNGWVPIGDPSSTTTGASIQNLTVEGNGHTVSGLVIDNPSYSSAGLFAQLEDSSVKDLHLTGVRIETDACLYTGALAAVVRSTTVTGCSVSGSVEANSATTGASGGLLVGAASLSTIEKCTVSGSLHGTATRGGGIAGTANTTQITRCYNMADIKGFADAGGIVGYYTAGYSALKNNGWYSVELYNCYNRADVEGRSTAGGLVGLLYYSTSGGGDGDWLGQRNLRLTSCYSTGSISKTDTAAAGSAGGIVGELRLTREHINMSVIFTNLVALNRSVRAAMTGDEVHPIVGSVVSGQYASASGCYAWDGIQYALHGSELQSPPASVGGTAQAYTSAAREQIRGVAGSGNIMTTTMWHNALWQTSIERLPVLIDVPGTQDSSIPLYILGEDASESNNNATGPGATTVHIYTAADLEAVRENHRSDIKGITYLLMADIDMGGVTWNSAIGGLNGTFDGQGYSIRNLKVYGGGLFQTVESGGSIKNLALLDVSVESGGMAGSFTGTLSGSLENCYAATSNWDDSDAIHVLCTGSPFTTEHAAGGLVGVLQGGAITNCYSAVNVSTSGEDSEAGGIAGAVRQPGDSQVESCFAAGVLISGGTAAGGIVGGVRDSASLSVKNCVALSANIKGTGGSTGRILGTGTSATLQGNTAWSGVMTGAVPQDGANLKDGQTKTMADLGQASAWNGFPAAAWGLYEASTPMLKGMSLQQYSYLQRQDFGLAEAELQQDTDGYYLIHNAQELALMSTWVGAGGKGAANYRLADDIDMSALLSGSAWTPIGAFSGVFDGNGKTISGFDVTNTATEFGLFGVIDGGTVKDFTLEGIVVSTANAETAGLVAARLNGGGLISGVTVKGEVVGTGTGNTGGIVGTIESSTVENCVAEVTVSGSVLGGVAARASGSGTKISACTVTGAISGSTAGGIVGFTQDTLIERCFSSAPVSSNEGSAGGIVGTMLGSDTITNCYTTGIITSVSGNSTYAGGIVGRINSTGSFVTNCYATGMVQGSAYTGGIVGSALNSATVQNNVALNAQAVSTFSSCAGRVIGNVNSNATISDNYAFEGMTLVNGVADPANAGTDVAKSDIWTSDFWSGDTPGFDLDTIWEIPEGTEPMLPVLRGLAGQSGALPFHLVGYVQDNVTLTLTADSTELLYSAQDRTVSLTATLNSSAAISQNALDWTHTAGSGVTLAKKSSTQYTLTVPAAFDGQITVRVELIANRAVWDSVTITASGSVPSTAPTVGTIAAPPAVDVGQVLALITPTMTENGAPVIAQGWQISADGTSWTDFDAATAMTNGHDGQSLRYYASTATDTRYSNVVRITVNLGSGTVYHVLIVNADAGGTVSGTSSGDYTEGSPVSVTATANSGYSFTGWTVTGVALSDTGANPAVFNMPAGNVTLTAKFKKDNSGADSTYTYRTLRHEATGVTLTGNFTSDATLVVTENALHAKGTCDACDEIRAKGGWVVLYDMSITGSHSGNVELALPVPSGYNGQQMQVWHCKANHVEKQTLTASGGYVRGTFSSLSPFAVFATDSDSDNVPAPQTGDDSNPWLWLGLMISALTLMGFAGWQYIKRRRNATGH